MYFLVALIARKLYCMFLVLKLDMLKKGLARIYLQTMVVGNHS
jgi:hypothetical protein